MIRVALISLARRGGMVHYHGALVNALSELVPTVSVTARKAYSIYYSKKLIQVTIDTGYGALATLLNIINPFIWYKAMQELMGSEADIFHITAPHEWNPLLGLLIKTFKKPLIFSMHDPEHHLGTPLYMQISDNFMAKISNAIVVLSRLGKNQLIHKDFPEEEVYYIPHGVYSQFTQNLAGHINKEKMFLFFGRIEPYKGLNLLLQAFSQVDLPGWKLVIAGNGDITPYMDYLNNPSVEIINRYIEDVEVAELMQKSAFVVAPYIGATQSGVVPIAYSFARPVIATNVGSLSETVIHEKTGLLVNPNNVQDLADAIIRMATSPDLCEQMGQYACKISQEEWGWDVISKKHLAMYLEVIARYNNR